MVDIIMKTNPDSFVGLLGVDQSVLTLMGNTNVQLFDTIEEDRSKQLDGYYLMTYG